MSFTFRLAKAEDDDELRAVSYEASMSDSGLFSLGYGREPSFFHGLEIEGPFQQTGLFVDENNRGAGTFTRTIRPLFVNGEKQDLGYIANARIRNEFRGSTITARAYKELKKLHADGRCPYYLSTILEGNVAVRKLLTSKRATLPAYHEVGRITCYAILLGRKVPVPSSVKIQKGSKELLPEIVDCLNRNNRRKQFGLCWSEEDFAKENNLTRGLQVEDFLVAFRDGKVCGVVSKWDQRTFKQMTVQRFSFSMKCVKWLWDTVMPWSGYVALPNVGDSFDIFFCATPAVDNDNKEVFQALLHTMVNENGGGDYLCCVAGFCDGDPLATVASSLLNFSYASRLYVVCWDDGEEAFQALENRIPYVEAATL